MTKKPFDDAFDLDDLDLESEEPEEALERAFAEGSELGASGRFGLLDEEPAPEGAAAAGPRIRMRAEIGAGSSRALDPQHHDTDTARAIALDLCNSLAEAYGKFDAVRPETLAIAVQTVLETLLSGVEREGVDAASMRVALANSLIVNGSGSVRIDVDGEAVPSGFARGGASVH